MNTRNFPAHGELSFSIEGRLLVIQGKGPANLELMIKYERSVQKFREKLESAPWASLVRLSGIALLPPEAKGLMIESMKQAQERKLVATALVLVDVEFAESVRHFWSEIYREASLPFDIFTNEDNARQWLDIQLSKTV